VTSQSNGSLSPDKGPPLAARGEPGRVGRVSALALRRGAPVGFLPRAIAVSFLAHGVVLAAFVAWGDRLPGGPPREVQASELRVARVDREAFPMETSAELDDPAEPEWTLEVLPAELFELPGAFEVELVEEDAVELDPPSERSPIERERGFEQLPLEPFAQPASAEPEPAELERVDPVDPIDETLVVGVQESEPVLVDGPAPSYPPLALRQGWEGTTLVRITVAADGSVADVAVEETSGYELLDDAALKAIRAWRFEPGLLGGLAREADLLHRVRFRLVDVGR